MKINWSILKENTYTGLGGYGPILLGQGQRLDRLNHKIAREVTANEADHLVVVKSSYHFVMWCRVEDFLDLLEEGLAIELRGGDKSILAQQDVLSSQRRVEVLIQ